MAQEVLMPKLGLTMTKGLIIKWLKGEGEAVQAGEPLLEIETEKLANTVECPADGVLLKQLGREGESYPVTEVIGWVGQAGEALPDAPGAAAAAAEAAPAAAAPAAPVAAKAAERKGGRIAISPLARKIAADRGIDYTALAGSGPGGRIVKADILAAVESGAGRATAAAQTAPVAVSAAGGPAVAQAIPYAGMRRAIGENMLRSWREVPHVTNHVSVDAGELLALRKTVNAGASEAGEKVSVTDLLVKIIARALAKMPAINASLQGEEIHCYSDVNISLAVALDNGLVTPVIRVADKKSLSAISREARELIAKARDGGLAPDDLAGGTFTLSNLGGYGSVDTFTPIINPPQAAILGVGRTVDTVMPVAGVPVVRPMMGLSLSYDHRVIDGAKAAEFIQLVMGLMENPILAIC